MAKFEDIGSGSLTNFKELLKNTTVSTFNNMVRGVVSVLVSTHVNNFNLMNYDFMNLHMFRSAYEKEITLSTLGENAYTDGNPDNTATPAQRPSYTKGNNYMEFVTNTRDAEKSGMLVTRVQKPGYENENKYLDMDKGNSQVEFTGSHLDRNSILYKTKKLMKMNKLKTIISQYHTDGTVTYNGQVGSEFGESHGRNLLTKKVELGGSPDKDEYDYDNPYCRVWTHNKQYKALNDTMRANSELLNRWEGFEWNESDTGHKKDTTKYGDDENYDYAWRGEHNQNRRKLHSVLDTVTGLVKMTPQHGDNENTNRHTKDCMFSIENLAWKDYDPYSFEQALSWEQRGPFGGRIMWFPPYGIEVNETATAKWQPNEFIGRGEPVYTYVNSERSGNLSFIMITDHPSVVDYASWWNDNNDTRATTGTSEMNTENDFLRYFAGCNKTDNGNIDSTTNDPNDSKTGGLIVKPTPMTDEYLQEELAPVIKKQKLPEPTPEPTPPQKEPENDKNPVYVEFFVFFPNNYSGVWDKPTKQDAQVNAIAYLLGGSDAMKQNQQDIPFDINSDDFNFEQFVNDTTVGYEMHDKPITSEFVKENKFYIQGGWKNSEKYKEQKDKEWCYRIDHIQPYKGGYQDPKNTINQLLYDLNGGIQVKDNENYKDNISYQLNLKVNSDIESQALHKDNLYSFAEVAAALYSENILNQPHLYKYLTDPTYGNPDPIPTNWGVNMDKVNELIELFTNNNQTLSNIICEGYASSHGMKKDERPLYTDGHYVIKDGMFVSAVGETNGDTYTDPFKRNFTLAENRAQTTLNWLQTNNKNKWNDVKYSLLNKDKDKLKAINVPESDKYNVNAKSAKLARCAHCIMEFTSGKTNQTTEEDIPISTTLKEVDIKADRIEDKSEQRNLVGFRYLESEKQPDGSVWDYYEKDGSVMYYDQKGVSKDNYDNPDKSDDIVACEQDVLNIFCNHIKPKDEPIIKKTPNYRGLYNERGFYIKGFDYSEQDDPQIIDFTYDVDNWYPRDRYVYNNGRLYTTKEDVDCVVEGKTKEQIWEEYGDKFIDISDFIVKYAEGDYVMVMDGSDEKFYECQENYTEIYPDFDFNENDWTKVTNANVEEAVLSLYTYCLKSNPEFHVKDIIMEDDGVLKVCTGVGESPYPHYNEEYWEVIEYEEFQPNEEPVPPYAGQFRYNIGDYVTHIDSYVHVNLYCCKDTTYYGTDFDERNWDLITVLVFDPDEEYYTAGTVVVQDNDTTIYYKAKIKVYPNVCKYYWSTDLSDAIPNLVKYTGNPLGYFDGDYMYAIADYCYNNGDTTYPNNFYYYKSKIDFSDKNVQNIPFNENDWRLMGDDETNNHAYTWDIAALVKKAAAVLCYTVDAMVLTISGDENNIFNDEKDKYACIWKYGTTNDLVTQASVFCDVDLYQYAEGLEPESRPNSGASSPKIQFTEQENRYLELIVEEEIKAGITVDEDARMIQLRIYIILYRILDLVTKVKDDSGTRNVCENPAENDEEMIQKTRRIDESETEGCDDKRWVDRGDGWLIQVCNINKEHDPTDLASARLDQRKGYNKLRYDQEYHFYKHFSETQPFLFQKLQQKLRYFNPALHSMTPEGFNARCTFLQQCTRQGNTKTMSDVNGKTANNLAFGRAPYCILRLGDFYNQMIIIENVSFDYSISDGMQWDLNPEGNGVQPMLCKVNISFKFIGGGDITGPVQRLQNAMSFNYYANASFYDNRADRVEYQPTNWKTMGGAGNDKMDMDKSYAYLAKMYEPRPENSIMTPVE